MVLAWVASLGGTDALCADTFASRPASLEGLRLANERGWTAPDGKAGETANADQQPEATSDETAAGRHTSTDSAANAPGEAVDDKPATLFDENDGKAGDKSSGKADS